MPPRAKTCDDCPFKIGSALNVSLAEGRLDEFRRHVAEGGWFPCHKTSARRLYEQAEPGTYGETAWDDLDFLERLQIVAKEQECVGARIWRQEGRVPAENE